MSEAPAMNADNLGLAYLKVGFRAGIPKLGLDPTMRLLATGNSTSGSPEESQRCDATSAFQIRSVCSKSRQSIGELRAREEGVVVVVSQ
jgi:hypothetical protein